MIRGTVDYKYPYIGKMKYKNSLFKSEYLFVMFTAECTGVVLIDQRDFSETRPGSYKTDWKEDKFTPLSFDERIYIQNVKN